MSIRTLQAFEEFGMVENVFVTVDEVDKSLCG